MIIKAYLTYRSIVSMWIICETSESGVHFPQKQLFYEIKKIIYFDENFIRNVTSSIKKWDI